VDCTLVIMPLSAAPREAPRGFTSPAESVGETCSNTGQEIAVSNSNFCIFCPDWVRLTIDGY